jgi:type II secretory pathway pseudopilin PulG
MLLVVAIIALLAATAGGLYARGHRRMLVEKTARDLVLAAKYARMLAVEKQRPCRLVLDTGASLFYLTIDVSDDQTGLTEKTVVRDQYCKPVELPPDVEFEKLRVTSDTGLTEQPAGASTEVVFAPNGTAEAAIVQLGDGTNHYTVVISAPTAKAKMMLGAAENIPSDTVDLDV